MIYLASPYFDSDPKIMQLRYDLVCEACAGLAKKKLVVFSPITHWHPIAAIYKLPRDHSFWRIQNYGMIDCCHQLYVLALDGWKTSAGIRDEEIYATQKGKCIKKVSLKECIS